MMDAVKAFNSELSSLYEVKPPISKAKMTALTRGAIKAIKFYKHVVQSVEKFILKCKPEYKVPGLYVIDSIVRQSRHQFGSDKDVFAPRFSKNIQQTFINLFKCPAEDKSKIIRVLNLWQKNQVFPVEVIQPLFDLADPNNPIYKELAVPLQQPTNGLNTSTTAPAKGSPALQRTPTKGNPPGNENVHGAASNLNLTDPNVIQQLQQLQRLLTKNVDNSSRAEQVHFDKKLLDFDYGDEEDEVNPSPRPQPNPNDSVSSLLTNPEVLRQLQTLQQSMSAPPEMDVDKMRKLQEMKQQEDEFDKHLAQTVPNLPFASECEFKPSSNVMMDGGYFISTDMNPPAPMGYQTQAYEQQQQQLKNASQQDNMPDVEVITLDHDDSRSGTPTDDRYSGNRRRRSSRSRSRDRGRRDRDRDRRSRRSRSRSANRSRHRSRSRDRDRNRPKEKKDEKETEKDRERKKRGLPILKKDHLSVCSTTLWVGHLSKLVHQDDLSNTFGEFGDVVSIDLIPPRGCAFIVMLRRQDAVRCLNKLKGHVLHAKAITLAWAPGKGVKGKDLKDYWEGDLGVSYIPYSKIKQDIDLEMLEDGGMIDEDTMPDWMREKIERMGKKQMSLPIEPSNFLLGRDIPNNPPAPIDTSQPPPMPGGGLLQPPLLPLVSPFQFNNRLLSMNVPPGMMPNLPNMPNIPIGVPPPNMPAPMMPNQLLGIGSPFQGPPGMLPPQLPNMDNKPRPPSTESNLQSLSESLMNITQPFGMVPQPPGPHDDTMDVEMEDAEKSLDKPMPLSEQLQQISVHLSGNANRGEDDRRDRDRDRVDARGKDRDRERDRERDRDRGRDRFDGRDRMDSRERDRRDGSRGRDRDRDRRDDRRNNRWGDRDRERERDRDRERDRERDRREPENKDEKRDREKSLNDRLREMAGMGSYDDSSRDKPRDRDRRSSEKERNFPPPPGPPPRGPLDGPPTIPDEEFVRGPPRKDFQNQMLEPPPMLRGPPDMRDGPPMDGPPRDFRYDGPPNMRMDGPPNMRMDGPPNMRMDGPPNMRMDGPPNMRMDGPPNMRMDMPPNMRPPMMRIEGPPLRMDGPPDMMNGPPDMLMDGPPDLMNGPGPRGPPDMMDGPPNMMDGPPNMMGGPPNMMMDGPPDMMNGPPDIPPHMRRDGPPFMHPRGRGRRDFNPRMNRPPGPDFFPRDNFGPPKGPPMMRGGPEFGPPRGHMGPRGPRGQFFGPRGPRGPRMPFRDGPNFNQRFDGPPNFRGRGPHMFNDGSPPMRFRGPRFDMPRRGRPDFDFNPDFEERGPPGMPPIHDRPERRSRWGNESPGMPEEGGEPFVSEGNEPFVSEGNDMETGGEDVREEGAGTPVRDECPPPVGEEADGGAQQENEISEEPPGVDPVAE